MPPIVGLAEGELTIEWPGPKPASFEISADLFESLIAELNTIRKIRRLIHELDDREHPI